MSRIGKKSIILPEKTEVKVSDGMIYVKGPLGELTRPIHPRVVISVEGNTAKVTPKSENESALWGTYASHLQNMVSGVNKPFEKRIILEGIGYKSEVKGNKIVLALGFSHPVEVEIPANLKVIAEKNIITVSGADKEKVGEFTASLRAR